MSIISADTHQYLNCFIDEQHREEYLLYRYVLWVFRDRGMPFGGSIHLHWTCLKVSMYVTPDNDNNYKQDTHVYGLLILK
jgi:hypothetical protein